MTLEPVRFDVEIHGSPTDVFAAFAEPDRLTAWWPEQADLDVRVGGRYRLSWPGPNWALFGRYEVVDRARHLAFTWNWEHEPDAPERRVDVRFSPAGETATRLEIEHGPYEDDDAGALAREHHVAGWTHFLGRLGTEQLRRLAHRAAARFIEHPKVAAAIVTGSVARGSTDTASDIDTILYLTESFTEDEYTAEVDRARASGGALYFGTAADGFAVFEFVEGVKCDFGLGTRDRFEQMMTEFLDDPAPTGEGQIVASGFLDAFPLAGHEWVASWQERLRAYPDSLAERMVRHHLNVAPRWVLSEMGVARGDTLFVTETALAAARQLLGLIYGINRRYHPGKVKDFASQLERLETLPDGFGADMATLVRGGADSVAALERLVPAVYDLVDAHVPDVSTTDARARFDAVFRR